MRDNKILAAAIASVVSLSGGAALLGASDVFAGSVTLVKPSTTAPEFATQLFPGGIIATTTTGTVTTNCGSDHNFVVQYKLPYTSGATQLEAGSVIKVKASLSNGAGWGTAVDPANQVRFCQSTGTGTFFTGSCAGDGTGADEHKVKITKSSVVGDIGASSVEFAIQATVAIAKESLASAFLYFCPDITADYLKTPGGSLSLTMESSQDVTSSTGKLINDVIGAAETLEIAKSKAALSVEIDAEKTPSAAAISFSADALKFATGSSKTSMVDIDRVSLGTVYIKELGSAKDRDGSTEYDEDFDGWTGKLSIIDGVFSASGGGQVFLDDSRDCLYDDSATATKKSIPATTITGDTAEWSSLTKDQLLALNTAPGLYVCVIADGVRTIEERANPPTATLQMGAGQPLTPYTPGRLRHLKENGTKCTLFNVPDGTEELSPTLSTDVVSIRITNNTATEGTLYATLYDQNGKQIYTPNKRQVIGTIAPFATVRYYTGQESMDGYDPAFDLTEFGSAQHWVGQRATLVVATELPDVSIFDLVRNRNSAPNMNMSTGATGNGCD